MDESEFYIWKNKKDIDNIIGNYSSILESSKV